MDDAELRLVIAACHASFDANSAGAVEKAIAGVDWERFVRLAERHRVQALCWHGLATARDAMPPAFRDQLQRAATAIVAANLQIAGESARLLKLFEEAGIPLLFLKGLTLGALAYPDPFRKMGWDIDLLVEPGRVAEVARMLRSAGYAPITPAQADEVRLKRWHARRKESVWWHQLSGIHIDLHSRLADNVRMLPTLGVNSPRQLVEVAPGILLPTLAREELFAYLAVHGASSAWFRLKWITDLAALVHRCDAAEIERLHARSQQLGAGRAAAQALLLANRLYSVPISDRLRSRLAADPANAWLAKAAWRAIETPAEPTDRRLGTAMIHFSQLALLPGMRFKFAETWRQLRDVIWRN
jgi:hypothetical protein